MLCSPLSFLKIPKNDNNIDTFSAKIHKNRGLNLLIVVEINTLTISLPPYRRFLWQIIVMYEFI